MLKKNSARNNESIIAGYTTVELDSMSLRKGESHGKLG